MIPYNPSNWYWRIPGSEAEVFSSSAMALVSVDHADYVAWLEAGGQSTAISSIAELNGVLAETFIGLGLTIVSPSNPDISGTYTVDPAAQSNITATSLCISVSGKFPGGGSSMQWPDAAGALHTFPNVAAFQSFAIAAAGFVSGVFYAKLGITPSLPASVVTIS